jgi:hypothetical protein
MIFSLSIVLLQKYPSLLFSQAKFPILTHIVGRF